MTSAGRAARQGGPEAILGTLDDLCPYLAAADGAWRATRPMREHACTAVRPVRAVPLERQREVCLGAAHLDCQVYQRTQAARRATAELEGLPLDRAPASRWLPSRPVVPVALDHPGTVPGLPAVGSQLRRGAQALLAAVMIAAAALLVAARLLGFGLVGSTVPASPSPSPTLSASPLGSASASAGVSPSPAVSLAPAEAPPTAAP